MEPDSPAAVIQTPSASSKKKKSKKEKKRKRDEAVASPIMTPNGVKDGSSSKKKKKERKSKKKDKANGDSSEQEQQASPTITQESPPISATDIQKVSSQTTTQQPVIGGSIISILASTSSSSAGRGHGPVAVRGAQEPEDAARGAGCRFKIKNVEVDGKRIKLQIWDTAGQERFRTITTSYFRGAQGILLVYDVTDRRSFESIRNWISQIQQHADVHVNKILVGNKCDMLDEKVVSTEEGSKLAREFGVDFFECSAKNDINVEQCFLSIARAVKDRLVKDGGGGPSTSGVRLKNPPTAGNRRNNGCC